jgi:uncharacterized protein YdeI (BOF family)
MRGYAKCIILIIFIMSCPVFAGSQGQKANSPPGETHSKHTEQKGTRLAQLVKDGKVLVAGKYLFFSGSTSIELLGETVVFDREGNAIPIPPLDVNVYCLDGTKQENVILLVELKYGGDQDSYIGTVKTAKEIPKGNCVFVKGTIEKAVESGEKTKPPECDLCPKPRKEKQSCAQEIGDLNMDGSFEAIVNRMWEGAPFGSWWELYELSYPCKSVYLGEIGQFSIP